MQNETIKERFIVIVNRNKYHFISSNSSKLDRTNSINNLFLRQYYKSHVQNMKNAKYRNVKPIFTKPFYTLLSFFFRRLRG